MITSLLLLATLAPGHAMAPLVAGTPIALPKAGRFDYMAVDSKYHRILAAHTGAKTLVVYDFKAKSVVEVETGVVNGVIVNDKLGRIFAAGGGQKLVALDQKTLEIVGSVDFDGPCDDIVMDTKREKIYVCHDDGENDWVVDAKTLAKEASVKVAGAPEYVEYNPVTDRLYQNIKPTNTLQVIDPSTNAVEEDWQTAPMESPHGLAIDIKTQRIFSAGKNGKMVVFDIATKKIIATVDVKPGIDQITFDPSNGRVYCAANGFISVVQETEDGAVSLGDVPAPAGAHTITVDPKSHTVWICYATDSASFLQSFRAAK